MSQFELDLIQKLSAQAAEPRAEFVDTLHKKLLNREQVLKTNVMPIRRHVMDFKKLTVGLVSLAILAGATAFVLADKFNNDGEVEQVAQTPTTNTSTTQTSSLPSQQVQDLEEAKKLLTFTPLLPSKQLNGETLSNIKVGTKNNMLDDSDTLYLTYSDSQGTLYKTSQSTKKLNYPTDAEKVTIRIDGKPVTANYYKLDEEQSGGVNSADSDVSVPTSYMFWSMNGVNYEISEFGRVPKAQLIDIASSLK